MRIIEVRSKVCICAAREAIRAAASQGRRAIMLLAKSCVISGAGASPERDSENGNRPTGEFFDSPPQPEKFGPVGMGDREAMLHGKLPKMKKTFES